jgi:hypothetical protein
VTTLCIYCRKRVAAVPDRNRIGRPIKRVCRECHSDLLRGDMVNILRERERRKQEEEARLRVTTTGEDDALTGRLRGG